jgi:hypothetical protein
MTVEELSPAWTTTSIALEPRRRLDLTTLGTSDGRLSPLAWLDLLAATDPGAGDAGTTRSYLHLRYLTSVVPDRFLLTEGGEATHGAGVVREAGGRRVAASLRTIMATASGDQLPPLPTRGRGAPMLARSFIINESERAAISDAIGDAPVGGSSRVGARVLLAAASRRLGVPQAGAIELWSLRPLPVGAVVRATSDDGMSWRLRTLASDLPVAVLRLTSLPALPVGVSPTSWLRPGTAPARRALASPTPA